MTGRFALTVALLLAARPADAVPGEGWVSGRNQIESAQLAQLVKAHAELVRMVQTTVAILHEANELAAFAREAKRQLDYTRSYSFDDLVRDLRRGAYRAWPDLAQLEREIEALAGNFGASSPATSGATRITTTTARWTAWSDGSSSCGPVRCGPRPAPWGPRRPRPPPSTPR